MCVKECTQNWVMKYSQGKQYSSSNWKPEQEFFGSLGRLQVVKICFLVSDKILVSICFSIYFLWSKPFVSHSQLNTSTVRQETVNIPTMSYLDFSMLIPHVCLSNSHITEMFLPSYGNAWTTQCFAETGRVSNYGYLSEKLPSRCLNENAITPEHLLISYSNYIDSTLLVTRGHHGSDGQYSENGVGCGKAVRVRL